MSDLEELMGNVTTYDPPFNGTDATNGTTDGKLSEGGSGVAIGIALVAIVLTVVAAVMGIYLRKKYFKVNGQRTFVPRYMPTTGEENPAFRDSLENPVNLGLAGPQPTPMTTFSSNNNDKSKERVNPQVSVDSFDTVFEGEDGRADIRRSPDLVESSH